MWNVKPMPKYMMVEGVKIELTPDQISVIQKVRKGRDKEMKSFHTVLLKFGFKKVDTRDYEDKTALCYEHVYYNWFADVQRGAPLTLWMVGAGIKNSRAFPGGWVYWNPEEVRAELEKAIDEVGKDDPTAGDYKEE